MTPEAGELAAIAFRLAIGAHAANNHRGLIEGIDPARPFEIVVANHPGEQGDSDQGERKPNIND